MPYVVIQIVRLVEKNNPDFVAAELRDAFGNLHTFVDKVPIFMDEYCLEDEPSFPMPGVLACELIERLIADDGRELARFDTELPWHIEATTGEHLFVVLAEAVHLEGHWPPRTSQE